MLTAVLGVSALACAQPTGYSINSRGNFTEDDRNLALWQVDLLSGDETYVGWTGSGDFTDIEGLAFDAAGDLYGTDDSTNTLVRVFAGSGFAEPVGGTSSNMGIPISETMDFGLTFTCDERLLVSSASAEQLYSADLETGQLTTIGDLGIPIVDLATVGDTVYGIGLGTDSAGNSAFPSLYEIDPDTAGVTEIGPLGGEARAYNQAGLAADDRGRLWAITDRRNVVAGEDDPQPGDVLHIDPLTGQAERVAETLVGIESLAIASPTACDFVAGDAGQAFPVPSLDPRGRGLLVVLILMMAAWGLRAGKSLIH